MAVDSARSQHTLAHKIHRETSTNRGRLPRQNASRNASIFAANARSVALKRRESPSHDDRTLGSARSPKETCRESLDSAIVIRRRSAESRAVQTTNAHHDAGAERMLDVDGERPTLVGERPSLLEARASPSFSLHSQPYSHCRCRVRRRCRVGDLDTTYHIPQGRQTLEWPSLLHGCVHGSVPHGGGSVTTTL
jgi:hypothetical protein